MWWILLLFYAREIEAGSIELFPGLFLVCGGRTCSQNDPALAGIPNLKYNEWNNPLLPILGAGTQQNFPYNNYQSTNNNGYYSNTINYNYNNQPATSFESSPSYYERQNALYSQKIPLQPQNLELNNNLATNSIQFDKQFLRKTSFRRNLKRSRVESKVLPDRKLSKRPKLKIKSRNGRILRTKTFKNYSIN
ncbi:unnamed protein product, partial [Mesorhabditis belari]|uniref:Uncharacterized protein n=1 Tax=Mesorhabditis belari TaxID=2138241 RepID=A0AAF3EZY6_9BILA